MLLSRSGHRVRVGIQCIALHTFGVRKIMRTFFFLVLQFASYVAIASFKKSSILNKKKVKFTSSAIK